jgi:hypothetical protein
LTGNSGALRHSVSGYHHGDEEDANEEVCEEAYEEVFL